MWFQVLISQNAAASFWWISVHYIAAKVLQRAHYWIMNCFLSKLDNMYDSPLFLNILCNAAYGANQQKSDIWSCRIQKELMTSKLCHSHPLLIDNTGPDQSQFLSPQTFVMKLQMIHAISSQILCFNHLQGVINFINLVMNNALYTCNGY